MLFFDDLMPKDADDPWTPTSSFLKTMIHRTLLISYEIYKTEIRDHETPIEILVNHTEQEPRCPRLDSNTWCSLSREDQVAWDTASDKGKSAIMAYAAKNHTKFTGPAGVLKNIGKKTCFSNDIPK